ncbi:MAG: PQQ-binding-like beta-propeller repeat protein [Hyphomicrobiaceae bacterium]
MINRRELLMALTAGAAIPYAGVSVHSKELLRLPTWRYGTSSSARDTVLMFRGNGSHTFYGTGPVPDTQPSIRWRFRTSTIRNTVRGKRMIWAGTGWTGTAIKLGDYVFFGSVGGRVYALDEATGRLMWQLRGGGMFKSSLCAYQNRLYIGNTDNLLRCIDAVSGRTLWTTNTGKDLDSSPCVVDDRLYVAGESGYLHCLSPQTGRRVWRRFVGGTGPGSVLGSNGSETSPAVADGQVFTATYDGVLFCVDAKSGEVNWKADTGDDTDASPVIYDEFVYACAEERAPFVYCFSRETGQEVWRYGRKARGFYSTPAIANDRLWVGAEDGKLHCIDARSGAAVWTFQTGAGVWSSPCSVDDKIVFGSRDGRLYCLDANTGERLWDLRLDGRIISSPCVVGGKIYIGTATGYFYCIGV